MSQRPPYTSVAAAAVTAFTDLHPDPPLWNYAAPLLASLVTDPRFTGDRRALLHALVRVPAAAVRAAVEQLASDSASPDREDALEALVDAGADQYAPELARLLLARLPDSIERMASLPVERCGLATIAGAAAAGRLG